MLLSPFQPKPDPYAAGLLGYIGDPVANMPAAPNMVAQAPAKRPGFMQRVLDKMMPAETAGGLISDEDIHNARRQGLLGLGMGLLEAGGPHQGGQNTLQNIGRAMQGMQQGYQGALAQRLAYQQAQQQHQAGAQDSTLKQQQIDANTTAAAQQGRLQQARQAIIGKYGKPGTGGEAEWIDNVLPDLIAAGDDEMVGRLSEIRKTLGTKTAGRGLDVTNLGNRTVWTDPTTGQIVREEKNASSPNTLMRLGEMTPAAQSMAEQRIISAFDNQTKDYTKAHEAWSQVDHVLQRARSNNHSPDDLVQLIDGISRLNNPGAVVRSSTVQLQLDKIGSLTQKLRMKLGQAKEGIWPTDIIEGIGRAAKAIADEHQRQYNALRKKAIVRGKHAGLDYMGDVLPDVWGEDGDASVTGDFDDASTGASSTAGGGNDLVGRYGSLR